MEEAQRLDDIMSTKSTTCVNTQRKGTVEKADKGELVTNKEQYPKGTILAKRR